MHGRCAQVLVATGHVELGPRLTRSNLEFVILQGSQFHRTKWQRVLQHSSRRPGRAAMPGQRLLFASDDFFIQGIIAVPRTQLSCAPTRSLTDEMLRVRRHDAMVAAVASASARLSAVGAASAATARLWRPLVARSGDKQQ